jgi:putative spermidine/putrescine transport system substrate-binding protein
MEDKMSRKQQLPAEITRRQFLKLSAMAGGAAFLASCAGPAAQATPWPVTAKPEDVLAAAQKEGSLTTIALPHDWANYGEIIETYKSKYNMKVNELNPDAGSADELEAIRANKESKGPQAPDVVDVGLGYTKTAKDEGLFAAWKVPDWDTIPADLKDPDGYWWAEYYGVLSFEVNTDVVTELPQDWEDLLKPVYKGKVAMAGDVLKSNEAVMTVFASGLSRSGGDMLKAPEAGLQFWKEMNDAGNFIPVIADQGKIAQGETPLTVEWDYLSLANRDALAGNPPIEILIPQTGVVGGPYAGGISAYAPQPAAARLWWNFVMSDEGQNLYLKGYAHPIRFNDMVKRGVVPQAMLDKLPPAENYAKAVFPTVDQLTVIKTYITDNWRKVVFGEG